MHRRLILLGIVAVALTGGAAADVTSEPARIVVAQDSCTSSCRAQWNQCRIATKGSPSCDAQLQACMRGCLRRR
jgi:hypothetical protein